jgi:hypothetical protein
VDKETRGRLHEARVWGRAKGLQERSRHRRKKGLEKRSLTMKEAEALARPAVTAMEQTLAAMQEALRPTIEHYVTYLDEGECSQNTALAGWAAFMKNAPTLKAFQHAYKEFLRVGGAYVERHEVKSVGLVGELPSEGEDVVKRLLEASRVSPELPADDSEKGKK